MSPSPDRRLRIMLLFGGQSAEHDVSRVSAVAVARALDPSRYDVVPVAITREGRWLLAERARAALETGEWPEAFEVDGTPVRLAERRAGIGASVVRLEFASRGDGSPLGAVDVAFPLLHGPYGEDGTLQGLLEMAGVPYVGSGVLASSVGMDKHFMKLVLHSSGLPVCRHVLVPPGPWEAQRDRVEAGVADLGWPVYVKPARAGSSVGVTKVSGPGGLETAVLAAREHDPKVLIEEAVAGREVECGVLQGLDGGPPEASAVGEIRVGGTHEFYDFEAKYLPEEATELDVPADLPDETAGEMRALSVRAFEAVGCEGLARVDFFLMPDGALVVNELNTMPGFTPLSMYPRMWAATGLDYPSLVDRLIRLALARDTGLR